MLSCLIASPDDSVFKIEAAIRAVNNFTRSRRLTSSRTVQEVSWTFYDPTLQQRVDILCLDILCRVKHAGSHDHSHSVPRSTILHHHICSIDTRCLYTHSRSRIRWQLSRTKDRTKHQQIPSSQLDSLAGKLTFLCEFIQHSGFRIDLAGLEIR